MPKAIAKKTPSTSALLKPGTRGLVTAIKNQYPQATEGQVADFANKILQWVAGKISEGWQVAALRNIEEGKIDLAVLALETNTNLVASPPLAPEKMQPATGSKRLKS